MTDEPAPSPSMHGLRKSAPERPLPFILTREVAKEAFDKGVDLGTGFAMVSSTPDGLLYQPITQEEFYATGDSFFGESMVQAARRKQRELMELCREALDEITGTRSLGGNIGGNGSEDT